jgi:hypothetical protein
MRLGAHQIAILSINVGSSSGARELLSRFETSHFLQHVFSGWLERPRADTAVFRFFK